ncbi:MAG: AEC family transporter, partial [Elainellaceae cyanobacterium]
WIAAVVAWIAVLIGGALAWSWIRWRESMGAGDRPQKVPTRQQGHRLSMLSPLNSPSKGSIINAAALGNTGYLGYPIVLMLVGPDHFAWAILYDTLGSTLTSYGLGVALAAYFGHAVPLPFGETLRRVGRAVLRNPAMWSFWIGVSIRQIALPPPIEAGTQAIAWGVIALSLLLLGMRLSQLSLRRHISAAMVSLGIKMLLVPGLIGCGLTLAGFDGAPRLVMVLQASMPPAFATLIIAEAYHLNIDLTVTTLALGTTAVLVTLPIWLFLFPV